MCKVIAIANQKGGVAKTTTTVNLGTALSQLGARVLLVDNDPQGSLTISLGQEPDELSVTLSTLMENTIREDKLPWDEGILHQTEGVDLIPANIDLSGLEVSLVNVMSRETVLRRYIEQIKEHYDYIIIDCNPSLGMLTLNSLTAADSVLIPVEAQYLSARGMVLLMQTIGTVKRQINRRLEIEGILLTKVQRGANHPKRIIEVIQAEYGTDVPIFKSMIPLSVRAAEASVARSSVLTFDPRSAVAKAYQELALELIGGAAHGEEA